MVYVRDASGATIGQVTTPCTFACLPRFDVLDAGMRKLYQIEPPSCCMGMCVNCCEGGCCNCKVPFHVFDAAGGSKGERVGNITKEWGGLLKELTTDADTLSVQFPHGTDPNKKGLLLASTFLINIAYFEAEDSCAADVCC